MSGDHPSAEQVSALVDTVYAPWDADAIRALGLDAARGLELALAGCRAAGKLEDPTQLWGVDIRCTLAAALFARRAAREDLALVELDRWLTTWVSPDPAAPPTPYQGIMGTLAADTARALARWDEAERYLKLGDTPETAANPLGQRDLCATGSKIYLELGLPDIAYHWQQRAESALAPFAKVDERTDENAAIFDNIVVGRSDNVRARVDIWLDTGRYDRAIADLRAELGRSEVYATRAELEGILEYRLGVALAASAKRGSPEDAEATQLLVAAMENTALNVSERLHAAMALTHTALSRDSDSTTASKYLEKANALFDSVHPESERATWGPENRAPRHWGLLGAYDAEIARLKGEKSDVEARVARLESAFRDFLVQWRSTPVREGGVGFLYASYRRAVLGELVHALTTARGDRGSADAFERVVEAQTCGTIGRKLELRAATVAEVRSRLCPPNGGIVLFLPVGRETHVFALDADQVEHGLVGPEWELAAAVRERLSVALPSKRDAAGAERSRAKTAAAGAEVAKTLLPPAVRARIATWKTCLVVGSELFGGVPFELLSLDGKRLLGLDVAIEYLPSVPLGLALAERAPAAKVWKQGLAFVGAPRTTERSERVWRAKPFSLRREELDALTRPFGRGFTTLTNEKATREAFASLDLADTAVLHVLCHGMHDALRERPAGLLLAETEEALGEVWSSDLATAPRVVPPIVILSACGAGRGTERLGEDALNHLGGTFLERGAICVILARQDLGLDATIALTAALHRRLAAGDSPAEALRAARVELAASETYGYPFDFSTLHVFGLGHERVLLPK
ncbi:MAG: CHAT domain-containing protein [Planctomycetes bacterium]|nr:CHAT domain-containing protein [Planctomycetota bacterium]